MSLNLDKSHVASAVAATVAGMLAAYYTLNDSRSPTAKASPKALSPRLYSQSQKPSLSDLEVLTSRTTKDSDCPLASKIVKNVPIYDCPSLDTTSEAATAALQDEWYLTLLHGAGVLVLKRMYTDHTVLDAANRAFANIITNEQQQFSAKGDHFAPGSANSRIWNSFSKHGLEDPESFLEYYSNPILALICHAYLGPAYRVTTQVNIVKPGGKPQVSHRDYHLGFQTAEAASQWPREMHVASQLLTLQGAVAQTDMPLDSGPTRLLPFSQMLDDGYMAYRLPVFNDFFLQNYISLPLEKGDGLFFNPAIFHAAGANNTADFDRSANLVQVSSAFGKTMESIDSIPLVERCWSGLLKKYQAQGMSKEVRAFVGAVAEGYPFPTNLDRRPPAPGGMAPESEQEVIIRALKEGWDTDKVVHSLKDMRADSAA